MSVWAVGNFKPTESFLGECQSTSVFQGIGLEQLTFGPNRRVFSGPDFSGLAGFPPETVLNFRSTATLVFQGFDVLLGGSANFTSGIVHNDGTWEIESDNGLHSTAGATITFRNNGTFAKTNGSGVTLVTTAFENQGEVRVDTGTLRFSSTVRLLGGKVATSPSGRVENTGELELSQNAATTFAGRLTNNGLIRFGGAAGNGTLGVDGSLVLSGDGRLSFEGGVLGGSDASSTLTLVGSQTTQGAGRIGSGATSQLRVINQGIVAVESGNLSIQTALGSGVIGFDNSAGRIQIADPAILSADWGTVSGGVIEGTGQAQIQSTNGVYRDVTFQGSLRSTGNGYVGVSGTVTNQGTLSLLNNASLQLAGDTFIGGAGTVVLTEQGSRIDNGNFGVGGALTIGTAQTVRGQGQIGLGSASELRVINQGTIAVEGGILSIQAARGSGVVGLDNSAGRIRIADDATLVADFGTVSGGVIEGTGQAQIQSTNGVYRDVTFQGSLRSTGNGYVGVSGTVTNQGTLSLLNNASLQLAGDTFIGGAGTVVLTEQGSRIDNGNFGVGGALTIGTAQTVRGQGQIGLGSASELRVINQGTIAVEGGILSIQAARGSGVVGLDNSAGRIRIADDATLVADFGTVSGGVIEGTGQAQIQSTNGVYRDVTFQGSLRSTGNGYVGVSGTVTNQGTLSLFNNASLQLAGDTFIGGAGTVVLAGPNTRIDNSTLGLGGSLTIGSGQTIRGEGRLIAASLTNQGSLIVENGQLELRTTSPEVFNRGVVLVDRAATLDASPMVLVQDASSAMSVVDGSLVVSRFVLDEGSLGGTGTIVGNVDVGNGRIEPGSSPGVLLIQGNLVLTDNSSVIAEIQGTLPGEFDRLSVSGTAALDGVLYVLISGHAAVGDTLSILMAGNGTSGAFDRVVSDGYVVDPLYTPTGLSIYVRGVAVVPEPALVYLFMAGGGFLLLMSRLQGWSQRVL